MVAGQRTTPREVAFCDLAGQWSPPLPYPSVLSDIHRENGLPRSPRFRFILGLIIKAAAQLSQHCPSGRLWVAADTRLCTPLPSPPPPSINPGHPRTLLGVRPTPYILGLPWMGKSREAPLRLTRLQSADGASVPLSPSSRSALAPGLMTWTARPGLRVLNRLSSTAHPGGSLTGI